MAGAAGRENSPLSLMPTRPLAVSQFSEYDVHECRHAKLPPCNKPDAYTSKILGGCRHCRAGENSQAQCSCRGQSFDELYCWQLQELTCRIVKEDSEGLRRTRHPHAVHRVRVCRAHTVLMTVYPNVIEVTTDLRDSGLMPAPRSQKFLKLVGVLAAQYYKSSPSTGLQVSMMLDLRLAMEGVAWLGVSY